MTSLLISWLISSAAIWLTAEFLPGFSVSGFKGAVIVAAVLGIFQVLLGWLIFAVIGVVTLGLGFLLAFITRWIVTAILLLLTDKVSDHLKIRSFGTALIGAVIISAVTMVAERLI